MGLNSLYSRDYLLLKTFRLLVISAKSFCVFLPYTYTIIAAHFRNFRRRCRSVLRPPAKAGQALRKTSRFGGTSLACLAVNYFYRKDARNTQRSEKLTTSILMVNALVPFVKKSPALAGQVLCSLWFNIFTTKTQGIHKTCPAKAGERKGAKN
jgi:hypothetical protein